MGLFKRIMSLFKDDPLELRYNIGQKYFSCDEVKHGVLRDNKKSPDAYFFKYFGGKDDRATLTHCGDPRVILCLMEDGYVPRKLEAFSFKELDEKLDKKTKEFLLSTVIYDPNESELIIPTIFKTYKTDFGTQKELINFILKFNKFTSNPDEVHNLVKSGKLMVSYGDD